MAKKLLLTLHKVSASTGATIVTDSILASEYTSQEVKAIVDTVLADPEFVASVEDDCSCTYQVTEQGNSVTVDPVDPATCNHLGLEDMLRVAVEFYHNMQVMHWILHTLNDRVLHSSTESYMYNAQYQIDRLGELCVEYLKIAPNPLKYLYTPIEIGYSCCSTEWAINTVRDLILKYVSCLELHYDKLDHDVQSILDNWIRDWKKEANYFLADSVIDQHSSVATIAAPVTCSTKIEDMENTIESASDDPNSDDYDPAVDLNYPEHPDELKLEKLKKEAKEAELLEKVYKDGSDAVDKPSDRQKYAFSCILRRDGHVDRPITEYGWYVSNKQAAAVLRRRISQKYPGFSITEPSVKML